MMSSEEYTLVANTIDGLRSVLSERAVDTVRNHFMRAFNERDPNFRADTFCAVSGMCSPEVENYFEGYK